MILYFSATGNSEYAAKRIAKITGDSAVNLLGKLRSRDHAELRSHRPWVVVVPTYAWRIPRVAEEWLRSAPLAGSREIYFVMTCGGSIGNAGAFLEKLCAGKSLDYRGAFPIVMPDNYIALYPTPTREESLALLAPAEERIEAAARLLLRGEPFPRPPVTVKDRLNSGIVNDLFYPLFVHAKKFYATDACVSCDLCVGACPLNNVRLDHGRPAWGDRCTHCMACICRCPAQAIEYGARTKGRPRYTCPKRAED